MDYLNLAQHQSFKNFKKLFSIYKENLEQQSNADAFCIDNDATLSMFGIRDCKALDYITATEKFNEASGMISFHNHLYKKFPVAIEDLIMNPNYHFNYKGVKFLALDTLFEFKSLRSHQKDQRDCKLILKLKNETAGATSLPLSLRIKSKLWRRYNLLKNSILKRVFGKKRVSFRDRYNTP